MKARISNFVEWIIKCVFATLIVGCAVVAVLYITKKPEPQLKAFPTAGTVYYNNANSFWHVKSNCPNLEYAKSYGPPTIAFLIEFTEFKNCQKTLPCPVCAYEYK